MFLNEIDYIGDIDAFSEYVLSEFRYVDNTSQLIYNKKATDAMKQMVENHPMGRQFVYIEVDINGQIQKVVIELFNDVAP